MPPGNNFRERPRTAPEHRLSRITDRPRPVYATVNLSKLNEVNSTMGEKNTCITRTAIVALSIALAGAHASDEDHRDLGAHEHGHGTLNLVAVGSELAIELVLPAVNVVGFEHEPRTDEQRAAMATTRARLQRAEELFVPNVAAKCRVDSVDVDFTGTVRDERDEHEEGHDEDGEESHSELHAEYRFVCDDASNLSEVEVRLLEQLLDVDELDVQLVTESQQTSMELKSDDASIKLK